jgi:hypothetical protein
LLNVETEEVFDFVEGRDRNISAENMGLDGGQI